MMVEWEKSGFGVKETGNKTNHQSTEDEASSGDYTVIVCEGVQSPLWVECLCSHSFTSLVMCIKH